ncbi:hypothetical protein Bxe_A2487 [Paraburkholderia xenovorans LB400]|uniref:Uncharacterized protein n=2 Tax=Paraburkholderia xenovorans TaxID=36873 RepID=Q13ZK3_PARXL|nr:hypothetical protein Bxe_A2487 [Paraburkholderia xenovorans LB400]
MERDSSEYRSESVAWESTLMDLWIQPCAACADLYGQPASKGPHDRLKLNNRGAEKDVRAEEHYTCVRCKAVFARILAGESHKQIWMLLNASQH